jgi:hypothetical protein
MVDPANGVFDEQAPSPDVSVIGAPHVDPTTVCTSADGFTCANAATRHSYAQATHRLSGRYGPRMTTKRSFLPPFEPRLISAIGKSPLAKPSRHCTGAIGTAASYTRRTLYMAWKMRQKPCSACFRARNLGKHLVKVAGAAVRLISGGAHHRRHRICLAAIFALRNRSYRRLHGSALRLTAKMG